MPESDSASVFGPRLKEARMARQMTQLQVARVIGVRENNLRRWENGHNLPQSYLLPDIAAALEVSIDWLFAVGEDGDSETGRRRRD